MKKTQRQAVFQLESYYSSSYNQRMKKILRNSSLLSPVLFFGFVISFVSLLSSCSHLAPKSSPLTPIQPKEISLMMFNVENLFDTEHDEGREDYPYLPLQLKKRDQKIQEACRSTSSNAYRLNECLTTDWNEISLDAKLSNLSSVVLGVDEKGPDVLMLAEVENERVLKIWNSKYLQKAQYQTVVLIEGPDIRGIDVGLMSRLPLAGQPTLHQIPWVPEKEDDRKYMFRSRNILEVPLKTPKGDTLTVMVAHFPSQANPPYWRRQAATFLAKLIKDKGPNAMVIAAGDLNITHDEEQRENLFKNILGTAGAVSHFVGCEHCPGTHAYRRGWSFLDAMVYSPALQPGGAGSYRVLPQTIDVIRYNPLHIRQGKYPKRWDNENLDGVSDHFPLYVRLREYNGEKETAWKKQMPKPEALK